MNKVSRLVMVLMCAAALVALPVATSCSSVVSAVNTFTGSSSSSSSSTADSYYLGIDDNGKLALYKGTPGDGSAPVRTTDIEVADLHESVVEGLKEGIVFDSFNEALERIGDYREAAKAAADSRDAKEDAEEKAAEAAKKEAEQVEAAAEREAAAQEAAEQSAPEPVPEAQPASEPVVAAPSDERAPAGEFWGVWLDSFTDLGAAYACADQAKSQGFASEVFEVTNWDGTTYVVGAGEFATKSEAQNVLSRAFELGYSSAYLHTAARQ